MSVKSRILSVVLAMAMFLSMLSVLPPIDAWAAAGDAPKVALEDPVIGDDYVTLKGHVTKNGGVKITKYGFGYKINGGSWVWDLTEATISSYVTFSCKIDDLEPGDEVYYVVLAENQYGEGKEYNAIYVPEEEPDIELDRPNITAPDEDDTFYAGEDITFKWGSVADAEGFEWELYESSKFYIDEFVDSGTTGTSSSKRRVTIDGDTFKQGYSYKFVVRAYCDNVYSPWDAVYLYIDEGDLSVDPEYLGFTAAGGEYDVDVFSSHSWEAYVSDDWIELSDYDGNGDEEITVYVERNTGEYRVGIVTIESAVGEVEITIEQNKGTASELNVDRTEINVSWDSEGGGFQVLGNVVDWEVIENVDWLRVSPTVGDHSSWVQVRVDVNESTQPRTATITVSGDGIERTVKVTQEGRPPMVGDLNGDGAVTNKDRFILNRYLAGMDGYTDIDRTVADINGDGLVTEVDAEYLTRHLAGWAGYENLRDLDSGTNTCAHTKYTDTYCNTVFVSSTNKTDSTHTYYHEYNRKCDDCGAAVGQVQGELTTEAHAYAADGLCACGAYDTNGYEQWTGVNVSGAIANVYSTPNAASRYGYINKDEVVTVLGEYGDKYLIEYKLDNGSGVKQGYVEKNKLVPQYLYNQNDLLDYIEDYYICATSPYEKKDDLAKDEISINFFDLVFADVTDLSGVIDKLFDGESDTVNTKHAIITLMNFMDDDIYYERVSECADVTITLYEWIENTSEDDIRSFFEGVAGEAIAISVICDIKAMKIDNINNTLSQGMEYLFECGLDNDAVMQKYAEILAIQSSNLDKKAAYTKVKNVAGSFGKTVSGIMDKLGKIATTADVLYSFYNVAIKDYSVDLAKLNALEVAAEAYHYEHLLKAVRELKSEMENKFDGVIKEAKELGLDIAMDYVFENAFGLWGIVSGAIGVTVGQDAMAKRDACYILEIEYALYCHINALIIEYRNGNTEVLENLKKALHMYTDCKGVLNALAIELNTWGIFVTSREKDQYGLTKFDYLSVYEYWYKQQHDVINELFADYI